MNRVPSASGGGPEPNPGTWLSEAVAGTSVALVLLPQSLAYAELAGLPAWRGLLAAGIPPIVASFSASSPWLQTGPTAITALLCYGALAPLAPPGSLEHASLAAILALMVGVIRLLLGRLRAGMLAALLSQAVLAGFTLAAALLIVGSQIPALLGVSPPEGDTLARAVAAVADPGRWHSESMLAAAVVAALILLGARLHRLLPGVLVAVGLAAWLAPVLGYQGATLGEIPSAVPALRLELPWRRLPELILPALVLAVAGFAEAAAIAQRFAEVERRRWDPDRELLAQGAANVASGLVGGMPVGGSFARSALGHVAGGRTRATGAVAGVLLLVALPWAGLLSSLPRAVLAAIVVVAARGLLDVRPMARLVSLSRPQAAIAMWTFAATLALAPRVELGLLAGMAVAVCVHLWREMDVHIDVQRTDEKVVVRPLGVLWFGSVPRFRQRLADVLADHKDIHRVEVDLSGLGRLDLSGALMLREMLDGLRSDGVAVCLLHTPPQLVRVVGRVAGDLDHRP